MRHGRLDHPQEVRRIEGLGHVVKRSHHSVVRPTCSSALPVSMITGTAGLIARSRGRAAYSHCTGFARSPPLAAGGPSYRVATSMTCSRLRGLVSGPRGARALGARHSPRWTAPG